MNDRIHYGVEIGENLRCVFEDASGDGDEARCLAVALAAEFTVDAFELAVDTRSRARADDPQSLITWRYFCVALGLIDDAAGQRVENPAGTDAVVEIEHNEVAVAKLDADAFEAILVLMVSAKRLGSRSPGRGIVVERIARRVAGLKWRLGSLIIPNLVAPHHPSPLVGIGLEDRRDGNRRRGAVSIMRGGVSHEHPPDRRLLEDRGGM